jgi:NAD(P)-dependent dehydrogenase (short-subunit alcohol dehydrogenase family)
MKSIEGKVILVTGASSGIGKALANFLAASGAKVYGTSRRPPDSGAEDAVAADDRRVIMIQLDVRSDESVSKAVRRVMDIEGRIDVLVNSAGFTLAGAVEDVSLAEAQGQFDTNFFGVLRMCREVLPGMRRRSGGLIINISSVAGLVPLPYQSMYSASKYAVEAVTEAIRMETKPFGIRAVLIEPGDTKTNCTANRQMAAATAGSVYEKSCMKAVSTMARSEQSAPEPRAILRVVLRVIGRKNPPVRIAIGFEYKVVGFLARVLPARLVEFAMRKVY